jgi:hypothetical protein
MANGTQILIHDLGLVYAIITAIAYEYIVFVSHNNTFLLYNTHLLYPLKILCTIANNEQSSE